MRRGEKTEEQVKEEEEKRKNMRKVMKKQDFVRMTASFDRVRGRGREW
jgi:hypothetical protein